MTLLGDVANDLRSTWEADIFDGGPLLSIVSGGLLSDLQSEQQESSPLSSDSWSIQVVDVKLRWSQFSNPAKTGRRNNILLVLCQCLKNVLPVTRRWKLPQLSREVSFYPGCWWYFGSSKVSKVASPQISMPFSYFLWQVGKILSATATHGENETYAIRFFQLVEKKSSVLRKGAHINVIERQENSSS